MSQKEIAEGALATLAERELGSFVAQAWMQVEPATQYTSGWHIGAISEHLQAVSDGELRRIIINIPPRHMKSLQTCVFWPAWDWIRNPSRRFLTASYAAVLSRRDAVRTRRLIQSPWYQARWGSRFKLADDQNEKSRYENNKGGYRIATSVGGSATGDGGDILILDDPHKAMDAQSDTIRENDVEWWRETWSTRLNDPKTSCEVIIMQRLHERDVTGYILSEVGGYEHLMLPARFDAGRRCSTSLITSKGERWQDTRKADGDLLWPNRYTSDELAGIEHKLGEYGTAGQMQQRPAPAGGGIFKAWTLRYWYPDDARPPPPERARMADGTTVECVQAPLPSRLVQHTQSWDCSFKGTEASDNVAGQLWAESLAGSYLLDAVCAKMDITATLAAVRAMSARWPQCLRKLIEDKANGPAVISTLEREVPGLVPVNPSGGKVVRAHACVPAFDAGNVWLPHPALYPWVRALVAELTTFPAGAHDDQVDACTQYLNYRYGTGVSYAEAMATW
jgi:predicted phage terminase large subunit-like protein